MLRWLVLLITHGAMLAVGIGLGVYYLPIITAQPGPSPEAIASASANTMFSGTFERNLPGSDFLHWGEGEVKLTPANIVHTGMLAPGPDYKLYLTSDFVDTKEGFLAIKDKAVRVGDVKSYNGFILPVPQGVDVNQFTTAVVWCESFSMFISAAKYR
jgi:hypothetical protein